MDPDLLLRSDDIRNVLDDSEDVGELLDFSDDGGSDVIVEGGEVPDNLFDELGLLRNDTESDESVEDRPILSSNESLLEAHFSRKKARGFCQ